MKKCLAGAEIEPTSFNFLICATLKIVPVPKFDRNYCLETLFGTYSLLGDGINKVYLIA